jgi:hypothetical protein
VVSPGEGVATKTRENEIEMRFGRVARTMLVRGPMARASSLRPSVVLLLATTFTACGGRVSPVDGLEDVEDTGGGPFEDGAIGGRDVGVGFDSGDGFDSSVIGRDAGSSTDTSVIGSDGGSSDGGVIGVDAGARDSGVIGSDVSPIDTGRTDSAITDTGVVGTDAGTIGPSVADCDRIAKASCTSAMKACCESRGFAYDAIGCQDVSNSWCDDGRDGVSAGTTTYDPTYLAACADAWTKLTTTCSVQLLDYVKTYVPCSQMLNGKTAPGGTCTRSTECHAPPGYAAFCDDSGTTRRCRAYAIVGAGAACNYYTATLRYCDHGLYCDYSSGGPVVCRAVTPIGGACFGIDDTSCGFGNTCKAGTCAAGTPLGGSCVRDLECASWSCTASKCTDPNAEIASALFCSGI